jgi:hypothetical protein
MYIEGHWEDVKTLEDVARVVREYYNAELADEMLGLIDQLVDGFNNKIEYLEEEVEYWMNDGHYDDDYDDK